MHFESDTSLIEKIRHNDINAFNELFNKYQKKVYNWAYKIIGSEDDAKDVVQNTFLSVLKSIDSLKSIKNFSSWLYKIVKNECLMKIRKSKQEELLIDDIDIETVVKSPEYKEKLLNESEIRKVLKEIINELPKIYRSVFILRCIKKLSTIETAKRLGVSISCVKTRLHRARGIIKRKLTEYLK